MFLAFAMVLACLMRFTTELQIIFDVSGNFDAILQPI